MGFRIDLPLGIQSPCQLMIGMYNHLQKTRYLASMKPFSVSVIGSLGYKQWYLFWLISAPKVDKPWVFSPKKSAHGDIAWNSMASFGKSGDFSNHHGDGAQKPYEIIGYSPTLGIRCGLNAHEGYQFGGNGGILGGTDGDP